MSIARDALYGIHLIGSLRHEGFRGETLLYSCLDAGNRSNLFVSTQLSSKRYKDDPHIFGELAEISVLVLRDSNRVH